MDVPIAVSQHSSTRIDFDNGTGGAAHGYEVADTVLIFEQDEHPVDDVFDERLCAEAKRNTDNSDTGNEGGDVQAQFGQDETGAEKKQENAERPLQRGSEGIGAT